jgi:large subunit ribosomal protein L5
MAPRLFETYKNDVVPKLKEEFGYTNLHQVPVITKTVLNMGPR